MMNALICSGERWAKADSWYRRHAEQLAGEHSAVAGDDFVFIVDQHRHVETEGANAFRNLCDLFLAVLSGVARVESKPIDGPVLNRELRVCRLLPLSIRHLDFRCVLHRDYLQVLSS